MPQKITLTPLLLHALSKSPDLTELKKLNASNQKLSKIGSYLQNLCPNLKSLDVSYNRLSSLDESEIPFASFDIDLSHNKIQSVTSSDVFPKVMGTLDLSHNQLTSVLSFLRDKFAINLVVRGNPLPGLYRSQIIREIPQVWCIDDVFITEKERLSVSSSSSSDDVSVKKPASVFNVRDLDTYSSSRYLDIFRNTPRKSKRTSYRFMKIRQLYASDHTVRPYPHKSRLRLASCLALIHGFNLPKSVRREALTCLDAEWMSDMKGFVAVAYLYDLLDNSDDCQLNRERDRLVDLACSRKYESVTNTRLGRVQRLDEICGAKIELDRVISRYHHEPRHIFAHALKAILSVRSLHLVWDQGRVRDGT